MGIVNEEHLNESTDDSTTKSRSDTTPHSITSVCVCVCVCVCVFVVWVKIRKRGKLWKKK